MGKLRTIWITTKSSLWFVPLLMVFLAAFLAYGLIELDLHFSTQLQQQWPRFFGVDADGARTILSTIAGSMITVVGVTFSITIVTLSLAANQYTSRVLRNFMRDRANQIVLGALVSIFVYCLIVLRTVRAGEHNFTPAICVLMAIVLAVIGMGLFIYFIHHIASSVQVSAIASTVAREALAVMQTLFPEEIGDNEEEARPTEEERSVQEGGPWQPVPAAISGYIQNLESDAVLRAAAEHETVIRFERSIGEFVMKDTPIFSIRNAEAPDEKMVRELNQLVGIQTYRTIEQDPVFGVRLIVDIALKALSPGINDPTTARNCIDHLGRILHVLARRRIPSPFRYRDGKLRVIARGPTFEYLADQMFHEIRQNARGSVAVYLQLLKMIEKVAEAGLTAERRRVLLKHVCLIADESDLRIKIAHDHRVIRERVRVAGGKLGDANEVQTLLALRAVA